MTHALRIRLLSFLGIALLITLNAVWLVQSQYFFESADILSLAITADMVILIPLIYFLLIRKTKISKFTLVPVLILSTLLAGAVLPKDHHFYVGLMEFILIPLEAFIIGFVIIKVSKIVKAQRASAGRSLDFMASLRAILQEHFPNRLATSLIATEVGTFYYALAGWSKQAEIGEEYAFTYYKKSGYTAIIVAVMMVAMIETVALHLALATWNEVVAWVLTALSIYSLFFLMGDFNAVKIRPIYLDEDFLHFRLGFRWSVKIPLSEIDSVEFIKKAPESDVHADMVLIGSPNLMITLKNEIQAEGLYGFKKQFRTFSLFVDEKDLFRETLKQAIQES